MITFSLKNAADLVSAAPPESEQMFTGITADSRLVKPGMLFAALPGSRTDGHDHVHTAANAGAVAALVSRPVTCELPQILVPDVLLALGRLAAAWRARCKPVVIGITGSNGKTTTKEMITNILAINARVLATEGNFNNELGLPLTLFSLEESHQFAVLEMGASKRGDIRYLAGIAAPDIGLVTNVGPAHLQGFGDEQGVARAKGEMYQALPSEGHAVLNLDDKWSDLWREMTAARNTVTFGRSKQCDVYLQSGSMGTRVMTPAGDFELTLGLPGEHNLQNALAATAVAVALNIDRQQIRHGLQNTRPVPGRLNLLHTKSGWTIIDDTYNANPASLYAALQVLAHEPGEPWLVLGDMKELGSGSRKMHAEMGEAARALGVRRVYAFGDASRSTVDAFGPGARHFADHDSLIRALCDDLVPGIACLVKGSRSMHMEKVVSAVSSACEMREAG